MKGHEWREGDCGTTRNQEDEQIGRVKNEKLTRQNVDNMECLSDTIFCSFSPTKGVLFSLYAVDYVANIILLNCDFLCV